MAGNSKAASNTDADKYIPKAPKQVRDQVAEAEKMWAKPEENPGGGVDPAAGATGAPPHPGNGAPSAEQPAGASPVVPPAADGKGKQAQSEPPPADDADQRFKSLQGRYDRLQETNRQMSERLNQMENLIASMQARGAQPPANDDAPPPEPKRFVTDEEEQEYGKEFLTVVGKRSREEFAPEFESLAQRMKRLEGRLDGVGTVLEKSQAKTVYQTLDEKIPDWRQINNDPVFMDWLQVMDPMSGRKRHDLLTEAFSRHEASRVVAFFQGFVSEAAGTPGDQPGKDPSAPPLPGNGQASGKPSLEDFTAPGRARSVPQSTSPDKPVYTHAQIAKFMSDRLSGKYRGREAEADAIERDIYLAQHEGRIQ